ncbi:tripartite tricarboxylate transporter substrate-binding protein [Achromobacter aloeverae]|nr:tripartite tricarboxylate transporter substrate-binding protein [Achromobacter aloeverae]
MKIMKHLHRCIAALVAGSLAQGLAAAAPAAAFHPTRPVTLVVPYGAGGGTDVVGRLFAQKLGAMWRQPVVVENRAGANGAIGAAYVAKAAPDGTTLLLSVASIAINPYMMAKQLPYDTRTAFTPITTLAFPVVVMVASTKVQASDVQGFIAEARKNPDKFTFGSAETSTRMYGERLKDSEHFSMRHIPYKGSPQWMSDLISGQVDTGYASITSALPFLNEGKVKILGVASTHRSALVPQVPTFLEQGVKNLESHSWYGLFGPGKMPPDTVQAIYHDVKAVLADAEVQDKLRFLGADPGGETPARFSQRFQADMNEYEDLIKRLHLSEDAP